jgi:DNA-directed RNA polymerase sigma subunit (sigma70/sigma32)
MVVDLDRISPLLRERLSPLQEKVVRLYYGLGCANSFSATEIAREFQVSRQMISGIVGIAQTKLAPVGLTPGVLREAARLSAKPWRHPCEAATKRSA